MKKILIVVDEDRENIKIKESIVNKLKEKYKEEELYIFDLQEKRIKPCEGCFECWYRTPGKCILNDDYEVYIDSLLKSELVIFITRVKYGTFSYTFKKVLDRGIADVIPFLSEGQDNGLKRNFRYDKRISLFIVGYGDVTKEEKENFLNLAEKIGQRYKTFYYSGTLIEVEGSELIDGEHSFN